MKKNPNSSLDSKFSSSAQKIKSILQESRGGDSKSSELTVSRTEHDLKVAKYLNLAKRINYLFKFKSKHYTSLFIIKLRRLSQEYNTKKRTSLKLIAFVMQESNLRLKTLAFGKFYLCKIKSTRKLELIRSSLFIVNFVCAHKIKKHLTWALQFIKHRQSMKQKEMKIVVSGPVIDSNNNSRTIIIDKSSSIMKTQKEQTTEQSEQAFSQNISTSLRQLVTYDRNSFVNLTLSELKSPMQIEVRKITNKSNLKGQHLLMVVLNNHIKAIFDLTQMSALGVANPGGNNLANRRSFNQKNSLTLYEDLGNEFFESDQQLNKLIVLNSELPKAQGAIQLAIKYYTSKAYRHRSNKIIESRVRLLELLLTLLRISSGQASNTTQGEIPTISDFKHKKTSFHELEVSHVRLIVEELDHKVYELSTISEQIPQLETFKRTLDLTMPQHCAYLTKIVDVLIQLHHKINKLISRRPEKLLRQIEAVEQECLIIETASGQFLLKFESDIQQRLKPIYFDQRSNKSPDYFRKIQKNVVKLSQIIIECMDMESQARERIIQIKSLIQVFWNLVAGMEEYEREWKVYKNREEKSPDEEQIVQMLQLCLKFVNDRFDKMSEDFDIERQTLIDTNAKNIQFLQEDINKMSRQISEQKVLIDELQKENEQLRNDVHTFEQRYKQLLRKYENDTQDYQGRISALQKKQKNYKDKIESLEAENEQKKIMITNITNDLKRVMKQSETNRKSSEKSKDEEQIISKLNLKIQDLCSQLLNVKQDNSILAKQKDQIQRNNDLLIKKLDDANRKINDLENQLSNQKHRHDRQVIRLKEQIQDLEKKNKKIGHQNSTIFDIKIKEHQKKEAQQKQTIHKKDQKISELNEKILDLNSKLNEILNNYKNMEFELQRKQRTIQDMTIKVKLANGIDANSHRELQKSYETSQFELNQALAEIDRCRNGIVPDLETEIRRRQAIITEMQRIINELEQKQSAILNHEQNNNSLKKLAEDAEAKLRHKQNELINKINKENELNNRIKQHENTIRDKDSKIISLENSINTLNSKISQLEHQLKQGSEDKTKIHQDQQKIRDLEFEKNQLKSDYQRKLRDLQRSLNESDRKAKNFEINDKKILELESDLQNRNHTIRELEAKIRNLENALQNNERELDRSKHLAEQLRNSERELSQLRQQVSMIQNSKQNQDKIRQLLKEIQYLKQKVRSLQDLIDIFTQQHGILEAKIKEYRLKEGSSQNSSNNYDKILAQYNKLTETYQRISIDHNKVVLEIRAKDQEIIDLKGKLQHLDNQQKNDIINRKLFDSTSKNELDQLKQENRILKSDLMSQKNIYSTQSSGWAFKERQYIDKINGFKRELETIQQKINGKHFDQKEQGDKYYLRIQGQRLEDLIRRMQSGNTFVNVKLDQILSNSRRAETVHESGELHTILQQNRILIQTVRKIMAEKQQLTSVVRDYPNPDFLTEYAFRIITYFSQIHPESPEGKAVWEQLQRIRRENTGQKYFIVLEQFTKFTLQQCAIEVYRRELKQKGEELQLLRSRLAVVIQQTLATQRIVYEKTALTESRVRMFRQKLAQSAINRIH